MKTCWDILGIEKTSDMDAIDRARRSMIRQWHPDTAMLAGEKNERTKHCIEINSAHDQALHYARISSPLVQPANESGDTRSHAPRAERSFHFTISRSSANHCMAAMALVLLFTFQSFLYLFGALVALSVLALGFAAVGILDFLFVNFAVKPALKAMARVGLPLSNDHRLLTAASLLPLNIVLVRIPSTVFGWTMLGGIVEYLFRTILACGIPLWLTVLALRNPAAGSEYYQRSGEAEA